MGFKYQSLSARDAVNDLMGHLQERAPKFGARDRLVTLILDGENAWEHYQKSPDGKAFFHELYGRLSETDAVGEIMPVAVTEYIEGNPDRGIPAHPVSSHDELEPLWGGSWIDATYSIWVGETEENLAWSFLQKTRQDLQNSGVPAFRAWDSVYAAEGSDWFWWYGDDMTSPSNDDSPFDLAFRTLLGSAYIFANQWRQKSGLQPIDVPDFPPIIQPRAKALTGPYTTPPVIDGELVPSESEWTEEGALFFDKDSSGTIANADDDIGLVYFGYDATKLYLAVTFNEVLSNKLGSDYHVSLYLSQKRVLDAATGQFTQRPFSTVGRHGEPLSFKSGGAAFELLLDLKPGVVHPRLFEAQAGGGWSEGSSSGIELGGPLPGAKLIELAIPHAVLDRAPTDPLEIFLTAVEGGIDAGSAVSIVDTAPLADARAIFEDPTNQIFIAFHLDATGSAVPLTLFTQLDTLPPPQGNGIVYIAGNQDKLANFVPNRVPMLDDGKGDDAVAGDGIWTATFPFERKTILRWKYTIGLPKDEGRWSRTEEFPLTERGYTVPADPSIKKVHLREIFADRPAPSGTLAPSTQVEEVR